MKEKIINAFKALGFELEELGELGYGFEYEGAHYLWLANGDDDMLSICIPGILNKEDAGEWEMLQLMDKINGSLKFVKANSVGDSVWLFYEHEMLGEEYFERLLPHMVIHLDHAYRMLINADNDEKVGPDAEEALSNDAPKVVSDEDINRNCIFEMPD